MDKGLKFNWVDENGNIIIQGHAEDVRPPAPPWTPADQANEWTVQEYARRVLSPQIAHSHQEKAG